VPFISITITNNMACSSPVSMENIRQVTALAATSRIPVLFDASRFAENAYFIKLREPGYAQHSILAIVREMFSYGDGLLDERKKDALVNIGGSLRCAMRPWLDAVRNGWCSTRLPHLWRLGSPGSRSRRRWPSRGVEEEYLRTERDRWRTWGAVRTGGVRCSKPFGGSGVFIDVQALYPQLPPENFQTSRWAATCIARACARGCLPVQASRARQERQGAGPHVSFRALRGSAPRLHQEPSGLRRRSHGKGEGKRGFRAAATAARTPRKFWGISFRSSNRSPNDRASEALSGAQTWSRPILSRRFWSRRAWPREAWSRDFDIAELGRGELCVAGLGVGFQSRSDRFWAHLFSDLDQRCGPPLPASSAGASSWAAMSMSLTNLKLAR